MARCDAEQCAFWTGDGCICGVMGLDEPPIELSPGAFMVFTRDEDYCACDQVRHGSGGCSKMKEDPRTHDLCTQCLFMCSP